jgi:hypothetical protein
MKSRRLIILALVIIVIGVAAAVTSRQVTGSVFGFGSPDRAPGNARVRVEVLNATSTRGLAQRATDLLRDKGFDVVEIGNSPDRVDSTLVLDRSNHPDWARRVAAAMGGAQVVARPDSARYVDVTVLIGPNWRPPVQPFHP